jgi:hypothetical protein
VGAHNDPALKRLRVTAAKCKSSARRKPKLSETHVVMAEVNSNGGSYSLPLSSRGLRIENAERMLAMLRNREALAK